jgi:hypothetical protein
MAADAETSSPLPPTDPLAFEIGDDGGLDGSRLSLPSAAADGQPSFCVGTESGISGKIRRVELRAREDQLAADGQVPTEEWRDDQFPELAKRAPSNSAPKTSTL